MEISVLASGSSGNSVFLQGKNTSFLVDAGISRRETLKRLSGIGKEEKDIDAIFLTHEHVDHIKGLLRLSKNIPVYLNKNTYHALPFSLANAEIFENGTEFSFNGIGITPISTSHDAIDPCGFRVQEGDNVIGIFTDFGRPNDAIRNVLQEADAMVLETNHDVDMLINGPYPYHLKQRILGDRGHLSNLDAGLLVKENGTGKLREVFLSHISKNNNTDDLAFDTFNSLAKQNKECRVNSILTSQDKPTDLIKI
jgi:phosphoribosyl 1,2-cyclic phosphodiesterase